MQQARGLVQRNLVIPSIRLLCSKGKVEKGEAPQASDDHKDAPESKASRSEKKWFGSLFVRKIEPVKESQSDLLSNQITVFELQKHVLKPEHMGSYLEDFSKFITTVNEKGTGAQLVASWTCEIGDQDTAYHLWSFPGGYPQLNKHYTEYRSAPDIEDYRRRRNEMLRSRQNQICLPFSFWPAVKNPSPREGGRIYELRSYTLKPGTMIEWGNYWARIIRQRSMNQEAVAGLFSHIGDMHVVHHIWTYHDLEHRNKCRDDAWRLPGWDECVLHTVPLIRHMTSNILRATPFSPMQ